MTSSFFKKEFFDVLPLLIIDFRGYRSRLIRFQGEANHFVRATV